MDYPFGLEAGVCTVFSLDIILKFSKASEIFKGIGIFRFSSRNFDGFFVQKNSWSGDANQMFLGDRLKNWYKLGFLHEKPKNLICNL